MLSTLDAADRAAVLQWIALLDVVMQRQRAPSAYQTPGDRVVSQALDALVAHDHTLPGYLRQVAREVLWQRDMPDTPLPVNRAWWAECQCRTCQRDRRHTPPDRRVAAYDAQLAVLRRQRCS